VLSTTTIAHAAIGRIGRPAFPAPSGFQKAGIKIKTRAQRAARIAKLWLLFTLPWRGRVDANEMSGGVG
jgi:hypothetical protein